MNSGGSPTSDVALASARGLVPGVSGVHKFGRNPDVVRLFYYAGLRDKGRTCANIVMDREWARAVAYYAASLLDRPLCDCTVVKQQLERYSQDLAFQSGADETGSYQISADDLDCPLGTRRGALLAWKRIVDRATGESVAL